MQVGCGVDSTYSSLFLQGDLLCTLDLHWVSCIFLFVSVTSCSSGACSDWPCPALQLWLHCSGSPLVTLIVCIDLFVCVFFICLLNIVCVDSICLCGDSSCCFVCPSLPVPHSLLRLLVAWLLVQHQSLTAQFVVLLLCCDVSAAASMHAADDSFLLMMATSSCCFLLTVRPTSTPVVSSVSCALARAPALCCCSR